MSSILPEMQVATLIFPNQLFEKHPAITESRTTVLYEEPLIFGNDPHWELNLHKKRLILYRAALRAYQEDLQSQGYTVEYLRNKGEMGIKPFTMLEDSLDLAALKEVHVVRFCDDLLERRFIQWSKRHEIKLVWYDSPMFLTPLNWGIDTISKTKKPLMASFYQHQR